MHDRKKYIFALYLVLVWGASTLQAAPKAPPQIPPGSDFVRSLDVEGYLQESDVTHQGSQYARVQSRYLDPDANAFAGLQTFVTLFNSDIPLGDPKNPDRSSFIWNWGANVGMIRGRHLWEVDLMGGVTASHLGFAPAIVGEHTLCKNFKLYHRTTANLFVGDTILDADQGGTWTPWTNWGISAGYVFLLGQHLNHHNGPHIGVLWHFESPKIPFIFPSLG